MFLDDRDQMAMDEQWVVQQVAKVKCASWEVRDCDQWTPCKPAGVSSDSVYHYNSCCTHWMGITSVYPCLVPGL